MFGRRAAGGAPTNVAAPASKASGGGFDPLAAFLDDEDIMAKTRESRSEQLPILAAAPASGASMGGRQQQPSEQGPSIESKPTGNTKGASSSAMSWLLEGDEGTKSRADKNEDAISDATDFATMMTKPSASFAPAATSQIGTTPSVSGRRGGGASSLSSGAPAHSAAAAPKSSMLSFLDDDDGGKSKPQPLSLSSQQSKSEQQQPTGANDVSAISPQSYVTTPVASNLAMPTTEGLHRPTTITTITTTSTTAVGARSSGEAFDVSTITSRVDRDVSLSGRTTTDGGFDSGRRNEREPTSGGGAAQQNFTYTRVDGGLGRSREADMPSFLDTTSVGMASGDGTVYEENPITRRSEEKLNSASNRLPLKAQQNDSSSSATAHKSSNNNNGAVVGVAHHYESLADEAAALENNLTMLNTSIAERQAILAALQHSIGGIGSGRDVSGVAPSDTSLMNSGDDVSSVEKGGGGGGQKSGMLFGSAETAEASAFERRKRAEEARIIQAQSHRERMSAIYQRSRGAIASYHRNALASAEGNFRERSTTLEKAIEEERAQVAELEAKAKEVSEQTVQAAVEAVFDSKGSGPSPTDGDATKGGGNYGGESGKSGASVAHFSAARQLEQHLEKILARMRRDFQENAEQTLSTQLIASVETLREERLRGFAEERQNRANLFKLHTDARAKTIESFSEKRRRDRQSVIDAMQSEVQLEWDKFVIERKVRTNTIASEADARVHQEIVKARQEGQHALERVLAKHTALLGDLEESSRQRVNETTARIAMEVQHQLRLFETEKKSVELTFQFAREAVGDGAVRHSLGSGGSFSLGMASIEAAATHARRLMQDIEAATYDAATHSATQESRRSVQQKEAVVEDLFQHVSKQREVLTRDWVKVQHMLSALANDAEHFAKSLSQGRGTLIAAQQYVDTTRGAWEKDLFRTMGNCFAGGPDAAVRRGEDIAGQILFNINFKVRDLLLKAEALMAVRRETESVVSQQDDRVMATREAEGQTVKKLLTLYESIASLSEQIEAKRHNIEAEKRELLGAIEATQEERQRVTKRSEELEEELARAKGELEKGSSALAQRKLQTVSSSTLNTRQHHHHHQVHEGFPLKVDHYQRFTHANHVNNGESTQSYPSRSGSSLEQQQPQRSDAYNIYSSSQSSRNSFPPTSSSRTGTTTTTATTTTQQTFSSSSLLMTRRGYGSSLQTPSSLSTGGFGSSGAEGAEGRRQRSPLAGGQRGGQLVRAYHALLDHHQSDRQQQQQRAVGSDDHLRHGTESSGSSGGIDTHTAQYAAGGRGALSVGSGDSEATTTATEGAEPQGGGRTDGSNTARHQQQQENQQSGSRTNSNGNTFATTNNNRGLSLPTTVQTVARSTLASASPLAESSHASRYAHLYEGSAMNTTAQTAADFVSLLRFGHVGGGRGESSGMMSTSNATTTADTSNAPQSAFGEAATRYSTTGINGAAGSGAEGGGGGGYYAATISSRSRHGEMGMGGGSETEDDRRRQRESRSQQQNDTSYGTYHETTAGTSKSRNNPNSIVRYDESANVGLSYLDGSSFGGAGGYVSAAVASETTTMDENSRRRGGGGEATQRSRSFGDPTTAATDASATGQPSSSYYDKNHPSYAATALTFEDEEEDDGERDESQTEDYREQQRRRQEALRYLSSESESSLAHERSRANREQSGAAAHDQSAFAWEQRYRETLPTTTTTATLTTSSSSGRSGGVVRDGSSSATLSQPQSSSHARTDEVEELYARIGGSVSERGAA